MKSPRKVKSSLRKARPMSMAAQKRLDNERALAASRRRAEQEIRDQIRVEGQQQGIKQTQAMYASSIAELQSKLAHTVSELDRAKASPPLPPIDHALNKRISNILAYNLVFDHLVTPTATATILVHNGATIEMRVLPLGDLVVMVAELKRFGYG